MKIGGKILKQKSGQLTIYIITGVVLIAIVIFFLILRAGIIPNPLSTSEIKDANSFLQGCVEDNLNGVISVLSKQGGSTQLNPSLTKEFKFKDENFISKFAYLCYTKENYLSCVNQKPMLISQIEKEIHDNTQTTVSDCLDDLINSYKKNGYEVSSKREDSFKVSIQENFIELAFNQDMTLTKAEKTIKIKKASARINSDIYKTLKVVEEIVNKESTSCDFNYISYMRIYSQWDIAQYSSKSDNSKIYTVKNRETENWFRFAVRGCVIPEGLG